MSDCKSDVIWHFKKRKILINTDMYILHSKRHIYIFNCNINKTQKVIIMQGPHL